ncbi:hypothetical protein D3C81_2125110 [compost metagenome]
MRLHFQDTAGDEDKFIFSLACNLDAYRTWSDACNQRRMSRQNPELARFTRQRDKFCLAGEDFFFG